LLAKGERSLVVELPDRAVRHDRRLNFRRTAEHTAWALSFRTSIWAMLFRKGSYLRVPERAFDPQPLLHAHGPQTLETEPLPG